jgi:hypothetical protein
VTLRNTLALREAHGRAFEQIDLGKINIDAQHGVPVGLHAATNWRSASPPPDSSLGE